MTSQNFLQKNNSLRQAKSLLLLVLILVLGMSSLSAQDLLPDSSFTITDIVSDDGWQTSMRGPSAMFADRRSGEVFVADAGNHRILVFDQRLQPKFSFEHFVKDRRSGRLVKGEPRDMVVNSAGEIILVDNLATHLDVLDFRGKPLEQIHLNRLYGDTTLTIKPQSLSIDSDDNLYVGTTGDVVTVMVLDSYFNLKKMIGHRGGAESEYNTILAIHVNDGRLYVTDLYAKPAIKVFDTTGTFLFGFGGHEIEKADVSFPSGVAILPDLEGNPLIWIVDGLRQVIKVFDANGEFVQLVGGYGIGPGEFRYPADIAALSDSVFYVVERIGNRVQRISIK